MAPGVSDSVNEWLQGASGVIMNGSVPDRGADGARRGAAGRVGEKRTVAPTLSHTTSFQSRLEKVNSHENPSSFSSY